MKKIKWLIVLPIISLGISFAETKDVKSDQASASINPENCKKEQTSFKNKDKTKMNLTAFHCDDKNSEILSFYRVYKDDQLIFDSVNNKIEKVDEKKVNEWRMVDLEDFNKDGYGDLVLFSFPYEQSVDIAFLSYNLEQNKMQFFTKDNAYGYEVIEDYLLTYSINSTRTSGHTNAIKVKNFANQYPSNVEASFSRNKAGKVISCNIDIDKKNKISNRLIKKLCWQ